MNHCSWDLLLSQFLHITHHNDLTSGLSSSQLPVALNFVGRVFTVLARGLEDSALVSAASSLLSTGLSESSSSAGRWSGELLCSGECLLWRDLLRWWSPCLWWSPSLCLWWSPSLGLWWSLFFLSFSFLSKTGRQQQRLKGTWRLVE